MQLALDPIWKAYEACERGADAKGILGKVVKGLSLHHVSILRVMAGLGQDCYIIVPRRKKQSEMQHKHIVHVVRGQAHRIA